MLKRGKNKKQKKYSVSQIVVWVISVLVVLSMAVGFAISVLPQPEPSTPTSVPLFGTPDANPALPLELTTPAPVAHRRLARCQQAKPTPPPAP